MIQRVLRTEFQGIESFFHDLGECPLPPCEEEYPLPQDREPKVWTDMSRELKSSDGIVVVSPEWGGMAPAALIFGRPGRASPLPRHK